MTQSNSTQQIIDEILDNIQLSVSEKTSLLNEDLESLPKNIRFSSWEFINESKQVQVFRNRLRLYQVADLQMQLKSMKEEKEKLKLQLDQVVSELQSSHASHSVIDAELQIQKNENQRLSRVLMSPGKVNRTISSYMYDMLTEINAVISVNFGQKEVALSETDNVEENVSKVLEAISHVASSHRQREQEIMQLQERLTQSEEELVKMHAYLEELFEEYKNLNDRHTTHESMEGMIQHSRELSANDLNISEIESISSSNTDHKKTVSKSPVMKQQSRRKVEAKKKSRSFWEYTPVRLFTRE